jgi:hypothetical protein
LSLDDLTELDLLPAALGEQRMGMRQSPNPLLNGCCVQGSVVGSAQPDDPFHHGQHVLGAVIDFLEQAVFRCLKVLYLAIFSGVDLRAEVVEQAAVVVADRAKMELIPER